MNGAHTQGQLRAGLPGERGPIYRERLCTPDGRLVAIVVNTDKPSDGEINAERLAACWNACEGVPTDLLEHYPAPFSELRAERDALLEALQALRLAHEQNKYRSWERGMPNFKKAEELADAAIAKATGATPCTAAPTRT